MAWDVLIAVLAVARSAIGFGKSAGTRNEGANFLFVIANLHTAIIHDDGAL